MKTRPYFKLTVLPPLPMSKAVDLTRDIHDGFHGTPCAEPWKNIDILRGFGQTDDQTGILLRKEALGYDHIKVSRQNDAADHDQQGQETVLQGNLESPPVGAEQAIETPLQNR